MSSPVLPHYSLGSSDAEHQRLIALASHEEEYVVGACHRAGIGEGATVVDLGCGPLGALAALANVVGRSGTVVGVDASAAAIARARTLLPPATYPQVTLVEADGNDVTLETLGIAGVALVYSRLMLLHQADPLRTLQQMAALLAPGGAVIAHEPSDLPQHAPASEPALPAMTRVWELVVGAARARGADTRFGRQGRRYLEDAGLALEQHRAYTVHYPPHIGFEIPRIALGSLRPTLAKHALASDEEIASLDQSLREAQSDPHVQWVSSPLMFEWIGRKAR